jgi:hypothetical protein
MEDFIIVLVGIGMGYFAGLLQGGIKIYNGIPKDVDTEQLNVSIPSSDEVANYYQQNNGINKW